MKQNNNRNCRYKAEGSTRNWHILCGVVLRRTKHKQNDMNSGQYYRNSLYRALFRRFKVRQVIARLTSVAQWVNEDFTFKDSLDSWNRRMGNSRRKQTAGVMLNIHASNRTCFHVSICGDCPGAQTLEICTCKVEPSTTIMLTDHRPKKAVTCVTNHSRCHDSYCGGTTSGEFEFEGWNWAQRTRGLFDGGLMTNTANTAHSVRSPLWAAILSLALLFGLQSKSS